MAFNVKGARAEGYSDAEIAEHLATEKKFNVKGARTDGYSDTEIVDFLTTYEPGPSTFEKVKTAAVQAKDNIIGAVVDPFGKGSEPEQPVASMVDADRVASGALRAAGPADPAQAANTAMQAEARQFVPMTVKPGQELEWLGQNNPDALNRLRAGTGKRAAAADIAQGAASLDRGMASQNAENVAAAEAEKANPHTANLKSGFYSAAGGLYGAMAATAANLSPHGKEGYSAKKLLELSNQQKDWGKAIQSEASKQNFRDADSKMAWMADQFLLNAPSTVVTLASIFSPATAPYALGAMAAYSGGGHYTDLVNAGVDNGTATMAALGYGVVEAAIERAIPIEIGQEVLRRFKTLDPLKQAQLGQRVARGVAAGTAAGTGMAVVEGGEEAVTGIIQRSIDQAVKQDALNKGQTDVAGKVGQEGVYDPDQIINDTMGGIAGGAPVAGAVGAVGGRDAARSAEGMVGDALLQDVDSRGFTPGTPLGDGPGEAEYRAATKQAFGGRVQTIKAEVEARKAKLRGELGIPEPADEINQDDLLDEIGGSDGLLDGATNAEVADPRGAVQAGDLGAGAGDATPAIDGGHVLGAAAGTPVGRVGEDQLSGTASGAASAVDAAAHEAATSPLNDLIEPTAAQKEAGNYRKGSIRIAGMNVAIENPQGSVRRGVSPDGKAWETPLVAHYGYVKGTKAGDGDASDVFIKAGTPDDYRGPVFVVDQVNKDGSFDEHKSVIGAATEDEARALYLGNYEAGWTGLGAITQMPVDAYKSWVRDGVKRKPLGAITAKENNAPTTEQVAPQAGQAQGAQGLSIGTTPNNAEPVTVKNGVVHVGKYPAMHFESGADVTVPAGADNAAIAQALRDAGVLSSRQRIYGLPKAAKPQPVAQPASPVAEVKKARAKRAAVSIKTSDELAAQSRKTFISAIKEMGGIKSADARDVSGEPAHIANRMAPGLFRTEGNAIDLIARRLHELGYLSDADYNGDVDGGSQAARDLIGQALSGEAVMTAAEKERYNELSAKEQELAEGMPARNEALADAIEDEATQDIDDDFDLDDLPTMSEADAMRAMGFTEEEINGQTNTQDGASQAAERTAEGRANEGAAAGAGQAGQTGAAGEGPVNRRDGTTRPTPEEHAALLSEVEALRTEKRTSQLAGIPNLVAFDEDAALGWEFVGAADMDGMSFYNDLLGHHPTDVLIRTVGDVLSRYAGDNVRFYHRSGDEFMARASDRAALENALSSAQAELEGVVTMIETVLDDGSRAKVRITGLGLSYGTNHTYAEADKNASQAKQDRTVAGKRAPKGSNPGGIEVLEEANGGARSLGERGESRESAQERLTGFSLDGQTAAQAEAADRAAKQAAAEKADADAKAEARQKADAERDDFTLTGSARASDANPGQADIFGQPELSPLTKAMNDLADTQARIDAQGRIVDDRLLARLERQKREVKELQQAEGKPNPVTPQVPTGDMEKYIKVAADSIETLRKVDVYRVLVESNRREFQRGIAEYIKAKRPDLAEEVDTVLAESAQEKPTASANTIFTEDAAAAARALLKKKLSGSQLNSGIDPEVMQAGITLAGYHVEKGTRSFIAYSKAMLEDLGDIVKPYLKSWYMGVKYDPRAAAFSGDMTDAGQVDRFDVDSLGEEAPADSVPVSKSAAEIRKFGAEAFRAGEKRIPPDFMAAASQKEWLSGWDAANVAVPVEDTAPAAVIEKIVGDKLETNLPEIEYVTGKGKTITGVIAKTLTKDQAASVDKFTWKKDGGYFIRMKHVVRPDVSGSHTAYDEASTPKTRAGAIASEVKAADVKPGDTLRFNGSRETWLGGRVLVKPGELVQVVGYGADKYNYNLSNGWQIEYAAIRGGYWEAVKPGATLNPEATNDAEQSRVPEQASPEAGNGQADRGAGRGSEPGGRPLGGGLAEGDAPAGSRGNAVAGGEGAGGSGTGGAGVRGGESVGRWNREPATAGDRPERPAAGLTDDQKAPSSEGVSLSTEPRADFTIEEDTAEAIEEGGQKTKARHNIAAIKIVKKLAAEDRRATVDEQKALARYVGWGGIKPIFDEGKADWSAPRDELKALLTAEEYAAARRSMLDAHYTSMDVVHGMWGAAKHLGFHGGRLIESSVGVGGFFGAMPKDMRANSTLYGAELDNITGAIAKYLYPNATIAAGVGFQDVEFPANSFDFATGNPPFGEQSLYDRAHPEFRSFSIHQFFFAKSLYTVRPGGILQMVVSRYLMDSRDASGFAAREYLAKHARLLGAIRLPYNAFLGNANTEVVTDIIFLQKLQDGETGNPEAWTDMADVETVHPKTGDRFTFPVNRYFVDHPEMVVGTHAPTGKMRQANQYNVEPPAEPLALALGKAVANLPRDVYVAAGKPLAELAAADAVVPEGVKVYGYYMEGEAIMQRLPDSVGQRQARAVEFKDGMAPKRAARMIHIRNTLRSLMRLELSEDATDGHIKVMRANLNNEYDAFRKMFGYINQPANRRAFADDPDLPLLESLEPGFDPGLGSEAAKKRDEPARKPSAGKADIFSKRVLQPLHEVKSVGSAKDALVVSLNERGRIDPEHMAEIYGKEWGDIHRELGELVYLDPNGSWETSDAYLSGNVKAKLKQAKLAAEKDEKFAVNVAALEAVQPADVPALKISVRLGSPWVPAPDMERFVSDLWGTKEPRVRFVQQVAKWSVNASSGDETARLATWGTRRVPAEDVLEHVLNNKPIVVKDNRGDSRNPNWVTNEPETEAARAKAQDMAAKFKEWIWQDQERRNRLERIYNDNYNTDVRRKYDGSHLTLPGSNPAIQLRPHQKAAIWRAIQDRTILLDHAVGAGKTYEMAGIAMELRRLGVSRKPILSVPNSLVRQWRDEFYKLYPNANVLAATEADFAKANRRRFMAKIATGDWDAVIVAHSSFKKIGMPAETEKAILAEQLNDIAEAVEELKRERGDKNIMRDMERMKEKIAERLKALADKGGKKDDVVTFDELGTDAMLLDEAHLFKNLFYTSGMRNVAGLGNPTGSGRAFDLFVKTRYLDQRYSGKAPVVFATGTPVSNSLVEMFTMQRYLSWNVLKDRGLHLLDAWAGVYGDVQNVYEVHPSGTGYRLSTRFAKFVNLPSLMDLYRGFADVVTLDDLKSQAKAAGGVFPVPKIKGGRPQNVVADRSEEQTRFFGVPEFVRVDGNILFELPESPQTYSVETDKEGKFYIAGKNKEHSATGKKYESYDEANEDMVRMVRTPMTGWNKDSILWKFENLKQLNKDSKGKINALSITNEARKAGLDFRLIDPGAPDFAGSKINLAMANALRIHKDWTADRGAQLIFCDLSVPQSAKAAAAVKEREAFVRREDGTLEKVKATVTTLEDVERAFLVVKRGTGEAARFMVYDGVTGAALDIEVGSRAEATKALAQAFETDLGMVDRMEQFSPIDDAEIADWKDANEKESADEDADGGEGALTVGELIGLSGGAKFSVYDDIKAKLLDAGIPASEIAFIHDFDTAAKKNDLFKRVNAGDIRILLGSTEKMGAGMNVQKRLVGLHHLDAPWRPSDLEQREGRIVRQGNELYARDPENFEVEILRYGTRQTYDTRMWQIIEHKAAGVEQLRKAGDDLLEIDDVGGEAANAADMKAAASGNPLILEEIKLRNETKSLEAQQYGHLQAKVQMQDRLAMYRRAPERMNEHLAMVLPHKAAADKHPVKPFSYTTPKGKTVDDAKNATTPVTEAFVLAAKGHAGDDVNAGTYRGVGIEFKRVLGAVSVTVVADSQPLWVATYDMDDKFSPGGLFTRIDNAMSRLDERERDIRAEADRKLAEIPKLEAEIEKPFAKEAELKAVRLKHRETVSKLAKAGGGVELSPEMKAELKLALVQRMIEGRNSVESPSAAYEEKTDGAPAQYELVDRHTGAVVGGPYKSKRVARIWQDKRDNEYGGYRYMVREVGGTSQVAESGAHGYSDPYESLETRPDTRPEQLDAGRRALAAAERRLFGANRAGMPDGPALLGSRISADFRSGGGTSLVGQTAETAEDLATIAQVLRDPRFETFRFFYTDAAGKIVGERAYSSRLPGAVWMPENLHVDVRGDMDRLKAAGYWMLHNHPSGAAAASRADLALTANMARMAKGFLGHVVIDHNEYNHISLDGVMAVGDVVKAPQLASIDLTANPEKSHPILGEAIEGARSLASLAKRLQKKDGYVVLIGRDGQGRVSMLTEVPANLLKGARKNRVAELRATVALKRAARETGSMMMFAAVPGSLMDYGVLIASGLLGDVVSMETGDSAVSFGMLRDSGLPRTKVEERGGKSFAESPNTPYGAPPTSPTQPQQTPPPGGVSASVPDETRARKAQRIVQDQFNRFTVIQEWLRDNGVQLGNKHDVYRAEERMHGKIAGQIEDFRETRLQPLIVRIHKAGFNMQQVGEYLVANHAAERNAQIAKINPGAVDNSGKPNGSGMTDAEARAVLAKYAGLHNFANFEAMAEEFRAITGDTQRILLDAGIISKEMADAWNGAYKHYVPLRGGPDEPGMGDASGKGVSVNARGERRRAMGHTARDEWAVENIIHAHERAIYLAEKNRVGQYLVSLAAAVPDSRLWTIDKPVKRKVLKPGQATFVVEHQGIAVGSFDTRKEADLFVTAMVTSGNKAPSNFTVTRTVGDPQVAYMASGSLADNEVQIYVRGNMVRIQLNDPLLARAYKKMGQTHLVGILEVGRTVNAFLSKAYTGLNPEFIVSNVQRDLISGVVNITGEEGVGIAGKALKNWLPSLRDMLRYSMTGKASVWVQMYREDGGNTGAAYLSDLERVGKSVQSAYDEAVGVRQLFRESKPGKATKVVFKKSLHLVTGWIEHLNAAAENGMRVALYRSMVEAGKGRAAAAAAAKNSTVNFNRKGEIGAQLSALYLFANPAIQGSASMGHALFKGKHKAQAWALMGTMAGLAYMLALAYGDDDEWDEVPQHEKDRNMLIRVGDHVAKIAVPYGHGLAFALGNAIYDLQRGKDTTEAAYHMASSILENIAPLNPLGDEPDLKFAVVELAPFEPFRIFARIGNNTSGFQRQIMPEPKFDESRPDFLKAYRNTHGSVYDQITRGMSKATGGTATQAGAIDVSPETLKFLFESATGGTGRFFMDSVQASRLAMQGSLPELKETPIVRKFVRDANRVSDSRARFWESVNQAETVIDNFRRAKNGVDVDAAGNFEGMQLAGLSSAVEKYKDVSGQARDAVAAIKSMEGKTAAEKRLMIFEVERAERELYRRMVKDINQRIGE